MFLTTPLSGNQSVPDTQLDFYITAAGGNNNNNGHMHPLPEIEKAPSGHPAHVPAEEVRNKLGHITLSVELLKFLMVGDDLKMYLDIITRASDQIKCLINEPPEPQMTNNVQTKEILDSLTSRWDMPENI